MTYNEYWQAVDAGLRPEDLIVFNYTKRSATTFWKTASMQR